ncbi:MAG: 30S ribosomal protein S20 [Ardenticatenales bacterium]|nr:30S ribosomal protein S20 [Ardenticatenales bacterium]
MANTKSAQKRIGQNERARLRNRRYISGSRTAVKKARTALASGNASTAETAVQSACAALDVAASKGVIHANNAARRKSRLMAAFNRLRAGA